MEPFILVPIAQLVELSAFNRNVAGSSPAGDTNLSWCNWQHKGL